MSGSSNAVESPLATQPARGAAPAEGRSIDVLRRAGAFSVRFAMLEVLVVLVIAAQISYPEFLTLVNLENLLVQNAGLALVAAGMTYVMIGGGFDLSVSGTFSLGSVLFAGLCVKSGESVPGALALALIAGIGCGLVNGLIVTKLHVNAFITTLGTAAAFGSVAALYSGSQAIMMAGVPGADTLGAGTLLRIPVPIVVIAVIFTAGGVILSRATYGRKLYATGGNEEAARLAGLPVDGIRIVAFVICGLTSTLAGAMLASTLATGQVDQNPTIALDAIAAVVIGGTSLFGGEGAMWRTVVGVLILATINNLFSSLAVDTPVQNIIKAGVVIGAVAFEMVVRRRHR